MCRSASAGAEWEDRIQLPVIYKGKCGCSLANILISYFSNFKDVYNIRILCLSVLEHIKLLHISISYTVKAVIPSVKTDLTSVSLDVGQLFLHK